MQFVFNIAVPACICESYCSPITACNSLELLTVLFTNSAKAIGQ